MGNLISGEFNIYNHKNVGVNSDFIINAGINVNVNDGLL